MHSKTFIQRKDQESKGSDKVKSGSFMVRRSPLKEEEQPVSKVGNSVIMRDVLLKDDDRA